ncbi:HNH endonuclease [Arsukibacterium tuosuense]|uniref:HNH endonuclease n=1 Tax=Arsukibacterium tuosuense TaxID=1323745 RepID=A0A285JF14_9GAMM|nr:HNH endonuclease signature motif containing protein [Arsukibacterium tuosuense]SNY58417.1 HNH endonuclease [Arsukibacterium tuosuense]
MTIDKRFALIDKNGIKRYPYKKEQKSTGRFGYALTAEGEQDRRGGGTYVDDIESVITKMVHEGWSVRAKPIGGTGNTVGILKKPLELIVGYEVDESLVHLVETAKLAPERVIGNENGKKQQASVEASVESGEVDYPTDEKVYREIKTRRGQAQFREALILAYQGKCFVSGSAVRNVLEAAHIVPHSNESNYSVNNGVLLRADIHTLYDLNLLGIDGNGTVHIHPEIAGSEYKKYDKKQANFEVSGELSNNLKSRYEAHFWEES